MKLLSSIMCNAVSYWMFDLKTVSYWMSSIGLTLKLNDNICNITRFTLNSYSMFLSSDMWAKLHVYCYKMFELWKYYVLSLLRYESMYESLACRSMFMRKVFNDLKDYVLKKCYFIYIFFLNVHISGEKIMREIQTSDFCFMRCNS